MHSRAAECCLTAGALFWMELSYENVLKGLRYHTLMFIFPIQRGGGPRSIVLMAMLTPGEDRQMMSALSENDNIRCSVMKLLDMNLTKS